MEADKIKKIDKTTPDKSSKAKLFVIGSIGGGVGKSATARVICSLLNWNDHPHQLVDADAKLDVAIAYAPDLAKKWKTNEVSGSRDFMRFSAAINEKDLLATQIFLSTDDELYQLGDRLLSLAGEADTVLNLPANNHAELRFWLSQNGLGTVECSEFDIISLWLTDGSVSDQQGFADFVNAYPLLKHVIVTNLGVKCNGSSWSQFTFESEVKSLIDSSIARWLRIEKLLGDPDIFKRASGGETFASIGETLKPILARKLQLWLDTNWRNLAETGYFPSKKE
jgi:hypothetical protein